MIAARQGGVQVRACYKITYTQLIGCHVLIYPGAFNLTTGPLHWKLLQRSRSVESRDCKDNDLRANRAVDNQVFVSMCSPARDMNSVYHAVRMTYLELVFFMLIISGSGVTQWRWIQCLYAVLDCMKIILTMLGGWL